MRVFNPPHFLRHIGMPTLREMTPEARKATGDADSQAACDRRRWRAEDTLAARGCWLGTTGTTAAAVRVADTHNGTRLFLDKGWGGEFNNCY